MKRLFLLVPFFLLFSLAFANNLNNELEYIIIDPAHGGKDSGAIGINNIQEKDETLNFSIMLKSEIEGLSRYKVKLTREQDETIKRDHRGNLDNKALVFIIHTGSNRDENIHGASVTVNPKLISSQSIKDSFLSNGVNVNVFEKGNGNINYILLEIGHITNKDDVLLLNSKNYREKVAKSISEIASKIINK
ncbi:N-acetylmuramoyl-L-alanine amidase [Aliivibrio finisterrensis]|uniref:N-acetylmuramoyl-L-alanine amidase n=1 Tax=Aliivibrio finisterrensis TaxID=511998 RepID=A0A4Q5KNP8_9GAMM|nr:MULTISPECIES: N-acetylmuramoyl-L-alanine amidase [Aliivibrio]MDD9174064.1 N-acetylmuramoyl-L-alanine amidase [Aliivibrio sp. S3TY1]MDD9191141.1 N-acetylmuramoyl-L-alanine amidase [Aliivibrio sp. S2TY2]RYU48155.1 N-acetylmuramoyl-L-alanine amidase [Aliivibrio finisterrensis]